MKILGMGMPELIIILCVVLLIFGPKNLPKLGASIGKTVKNLRDGMNSAENEEVEEDTSVKAIEDVSEEEQENAPVKKKVVKKAVEATA